MFCPKCGNSLPDNARFCNVCGNDMSQPMQQPFAAQPSFPAQPVEQPQQPFATQPVPTYTNNASLTDNITQSGSAGADRESTNGASGRRSAHPEITSGAVEFERPPADIYPEDGISAEAAEPFAPMTPDTSAASVTFQAPPAPAEPLGAASSAAPEFPAAGLPTPANVSSFENAPAAPAAPANGLPTPADTASFTSAASAPVSPLIPEQPVEPVIPTEPAPMSQNFAMPAAAPGQPVYQAPPAVKAPKKKKGKAGVIAGVTAAAVVVGGGGAGYFLFHDDITRMVMGESGYAQMVSRSAFSEIDKEKENASGLIARTLDTSFRSAARSLPEFSGNSSYGMTTSDYLSDPADMIANASGILPEGTALSASANINISAGNLINDSIPAEVNDIIKLINGLTFTSKAANGENDLISFGIADGSGNIGSIEIYRTADGDVIAAFPGITDKTIEIKHEDRGSSDPSGSAQNVKFDEAEAKRIVDEIINIYYESYDSAEITYTDGVSMTGALRGSDADVNITVTGTEAKIVFSGEQMIAVMKKTSEFLSSDAYIKSYAKDALGIDENELADMLEVKDTDTSKLPTVTISHIVDVHNNVLATTISAKSSESSAALSVRSLEKDSDKYMSVDITDGNGTNYTIQKAVNKKSEKDGNAVLSFSQGGKNEFTVSVDCAYSGFSMESWAGSKVPVGKFTIKFSDPDAFAAQLKKSTSPNGKTMQSVGPGGGLDTDSLIDELKKLNITADTSLSGTKYSGTFTVSVGDIGSFTLSTDAETSTAAVTLPSDSGRVDLNDSSALSGLTADAVKWLREFVKRSDTLEMMYGSSLDDMTDSQSGTNNNGLDGKDDDDVSPIIDVDPDEPVVIDDSLEPAQMDYAAKLFSGAAEDLLGFNGDVTGFTNSEADDMTAVFECDEYGSWKMTKAYNGRREVSAGVFSDRFEDEMIERLEDAVSYNDPEINGMSAGFYFSGGKYVGCLVMPKDRNADFDLYGLPGADAFRTGIFSGWYSTGEYDGQSGYFADYDGSAMYVGTYCVNSGVPLKNPEEIGAEFYMGLDGEWEAVDVDGVDWDEYFVEDKYDLLYKPTFRLRGYTMIMENTELTLSFRHDAGDPVIADIYRGYSEDPIGTVEFGSDGDTAVIIDNITGASVGFRRINYENIAGQYIGELCYYPDLEDIAGVWVTESLQEERYMAISSYGIMSPFETDQQDYYFLDPRDCLIDIYPAYDDFSEPVGYMFYSEESGKVLIQYEGADAPLILRKSEDATKPPYAGEWKIKEGTSSWNEDMILAVTDFYAVFSYDDEVEIFIIFSRSGDDTDKVFRLYPEYNDPSNSYEIICEYDASEETISLTYPDDESGQPSAVFERY